MNRKYQHSHHNDIHWVELIALFTAGSLSIAILYKIFVMPNWNHLSQLNHTLSWTSLIR